MGPGRAAGGGLREFDSSLLEVLAKQRKWRDVRREAEAMIGRGGRQRSLSPDVYLATACAELGDATAALAALQPLDDVKADGMVWAKLQRPRVLNLLGRHDQAAAECDKLLTAYPRPSDARRVRLQLSEAYLGLKEYAKAEAELRAILDHDPDDVLALNNLGYNLADQGRNLAEAEELVRRAVELDGAERRRAGGPDAENGVYLDSLGWVLFRRGKLPEARRLLERATGLPDSASDAVVWDHLGDVCFRLGDVPAAVRAWEAAKELYADSHQGRQGGRRDEVTRKLRQVR
mgnify:CR=1 FL=1